MQTQYLKILFSPLCNSGIAVGQPILDKDNDPIGFVYKVHESSVDILLFEQQAGDDPRAISLSEKVPAEFVATKLLDIMEDDLELREFWINYLSDDGEIQL